MLQLLQIVSFMDWIEKAKDCPVLKGLDNSELIEVVGQVNFQLKSFNPDDIIAFQGDEVKALMILLNGSVRGEMTDFSGRMIKIEDIYAPKPIAGAFIFSKENKYPVEVIANEKVKILVIYREEFLKLSTISPVIQKNYLNLISSKAQFLSRKIKFLSFKTIKGKMAHYILQQKPGPDGIIHLPVSQQDIANLFGVARPSVARALKNMEDGGIIRSKNRQIDILDHEALVGLLNE